MAAGYATLLFLLQLSVNVSFLSQVVTGEYSLEWEEGCATTFSELEEYIFSNNTSNHEILQSIFFPVNELSPSYVQVRYNHHCNKTGGLMECNNRKFVAPANETWLWASSPVYLVYHPEALSALAMIIQLHDVGKLGTAFRTDIGGDTVCVCLPPICADTSDSKKEMLRNLTALLYGYASVRTVSQKSLENIWYAVLIEELWDTSYNITPGTTQLPTLIYIFINLSNLSLNIVLIPLLVYACHHVMEKIKANQTGSFLYSSVWWALFMGALLVLYALARLNYNGVCWKGNDCTKAGLALPSASAALRLLIPFLGYIIGIVLKLRITRKFCLPFGVQVLVTAIQFVNKRCAEIIYSFCHYLVLLLILIAVHGICSHLQFVVFASFDNPFRVLSNVTQNLSLAMLFTILCANYFMIDLMVTEIIFTKSTRNTSLYLKQLFQFVQVSLSIMIFCSWLYAFGYLGAHQHNEFVDGLQTVLEFFTVPLTIGLLGYTIKCSVYRMNDIVDPPLSVLSTNNVGTFS